jgi:hypothetical protein
MRKGEKELDYINSEAPSNAWYEHWNTDGTVDNSVGTVTLQYATQLHDLSTAIRARKLFESCM